MPTGTATVRPTVKVGGSALGPTVEPLLIRTRVETHLHLPDMFTLVFLDESGTLAEDAHLKIGAEVTIHAGAPDSTSAQKLINGEITSIEGEYEDLVIHTIVRGYEKSHRLQRARHTRTFVDMSDGDIAKKVADGAGLDIGTVDDPGVTHKHVAQIAQTDWEFLRSRAIELGYETGVTDGKFFFRKASGTPAGGLGGALGALGDAAAALGLGGGPPKLAFKDNLLMFRPRLSAANLVSEVEVRVWDPKSAKVVVGKAPAETHTAELDDKPADLAGRFGAGGLAGLIPSIPSIPGLPDLGLPASPKAFLAVNRPLDWGSATHSAADAAAKGVADHVSSTFAEAEGLAVGNPDIQAGKKVDIDQVPKMFKGKWVVTSACHLFDDEEGGYHTRFEVSGRQDRSLLGLTSGRGNVANHPTLEGFVCAIVTNNNDSDDLNRVKLAFPWLAPDFESDWARVVQLDAGTKGGALFLPEVGDEVLVGFEFGDVRRPYVVGSLINGNSKIDLGGKPVQQSFPTAKVVRRGFISRNGEQIVIEDDGGPPLGSKLCIKIGDKDNKVALKLDKANGEITITCDPMIPPGKINIEAKGVGSTVSVKSAGDVSIEASAPGQLTLKGGMGVEISSSGPVKISGTPLQLTGQPITLN